MLDIEGAIQNPSKSETHDDVEKTIANQMARFTIAFTDSSDKMESLKTVCALGMDLVKTCGMKVCEDTSMTLTHIIRKINVEMSYQFQQISNGAHNNDVCVYLYLALPTINNDVSKSSLMGLCDSTVDKMSDMYDEISPMTNFKSIDSDKVKSLYREYLNKTV